MTSHIQYQSFAQVRAIGELPCLTRDQLSSGTDNKELAEGTFVMSIFQTVHCIATLNSGYDISLAVAAQASCHKHKVYVSVNE